MRMWLIRCGCGNHHPNGNVATPARSMVKMTKNGLTKDRAPQGASTHHERATECAAPPNSAKLAQREPHRRRAGGSNSILIARETTSSRSTTKLLQD